MSNTYTETVFKFRVMRQLADAERNPEGSWSLVYSSPDRSDAEAVMEDQKEMWKRTKDQFRVVEGKETTIERSVW
jgi:hypothetical protein